jgi:hypothetical protein
LYCREGEINTNIAGTEVAFVTVAKICVCYALKYLQREHKVKKIRSLGIDMIDYFYQIMNMNSDPK